MNTNQVKVSEYDLGITTVVLNGASTNASSSTALLKNQTKQIGLLKAHALSQEIKINELIKIVDIMVSPEPPTKNYNPSAYTMFTSRID
jgi:hypothetical protein